MDKDREVYCTPRTAGIGKCYGYDKDWPPASSTGFGLFYVVLA